MPERDMDQLRQLQLPRQVSLEVSVDARGAYQIPDCSFTEIGGGGYGCIGDIQIF